jgi:hypothetical protein
MARVPLLNERERIFVDYFVCDALARNSATLSARRAGYRNPAQAGAKLLTLVKIEMAIQAKREVEEIRRQAEAKRTAPLDYQPVEEGGPQVSKAPAMDRPTHSAELVDERLLIRSGARRVPRHPGRHFIGRSGQAE